MVDTHFALAHGSELLGIDRGDLRQVLTGSLYLRTGLDGCNSERLRPLQFAAYFEHSHLDN